MKYLVALLMVVVLTTSANAFHGRGRVSVNVRSGGGFNAPYCGGFGGGYYRSLPQREVIILDTFDDGFSRCPPVRQSFRSFESFRSFGY